MTKQKAIETLEKFAAANDQLAAEAPPGEFRQRYRGCASGLRKAIEVVEQIESEPA